MPICNWPSIGPPRASSTIASMPWPPPRCPITRNCAPRPTPSSTTPSTIWIITSKQFEANVTAHGGHVVYCQDATEVADFVLGLAKERAAHLIVKSKSMTTEEVDLNERLEHHHLESVETDLGEYILQLAHQRPYHIVAPALHLTRYDVGDLFARTLGVPNETVVEKQTLIARAVLREKFLAADIGISGANFLVADSGAVVIVENEGNARLTTSAPQDPHRRGRHREADSARAGSGRIPEAAGPQRHRPGA